MSEHNNTLDDTVKQIQKFMEEHKPVGPLPKNDMAWMTPPMVAAESISAMANPLSGPSALERNLDRMAECVREEAIAEFMATPEAKAAQAELLGEAKARVATALERIELGRPDFTSEMNAPTVPDDGCWRPEQVNPRGRWRMKKRALRQLAEDLNYPDCMEVAHPEQIDGAVMQAGVRLRDFYKLHRVRTTPAQAKAEWAQRRADRREMARTIARGEPPF